MKIFLRDVTLDDGKAIVKWRNSPQVSKHCFNKLPITEESNKEFYETYVMTGRYKQYIVECVDEQYGALAYPIGTIYLKDMDHTNKRCELCIFTNGDVEWDDENQSIAVKMLLDKCFNEFDMHKVYAFVFAEFMDEAELLKKAGFRVEAILSEEALDSDGKYADAVRFCILKEDYERK